MAFFKHKSCDTLQYNVNLYFLLYLKLKKKHLWQDIFFNHWLQCDLLSSFTLSCISPGIVMHLYSILFYPCENDDHAYACTSVPVSLQ